MNNGNDNSLLGFLKKKSLFANSPSKMTRKRSRSRSKDSKNLDQRSNHNSFDQKQAEDPYQQSRKPKFVYQEQAFRNNERNDVKPYAFNPENGNKYDSGIADSRLFRTNAQVGKNSRLTEEKYSTISKRLDDKPFENQIWTGLVSFTNSFESARLQSSQCLDSLSVKLGTEIANINYRIDVFNSKMAKVLSSEFRAIKEKISSIFQNAFKESEIYIKQYMKSKEIEMAGDLLKMKEILEKEGMKIESMKDELSKPNWRRAAGQILSTELETKIEELIRKSNELTVRHWQLGDIGTYRIRNIETELRELIHLRPT